MSEMACLFLVLIVWLTFCYFHETDFDLKGKDKKFLDGFSAKLLDGNTKSGLRTSLLAHTAKDDAEHQLEKNPEPDHRHFVRDFFAYEHPETGGGVMHFLKHKCPLLRCGGDKTGTQKKANLVHQFWTNKLMGHGLQPGGFAPRFTALSMGLLLFVGGTIVKTDTPEVSLKKMEGYDGCRAMAKDVSVPFWFSRMWRQPPVGCFGLNPSQDFVSEPINALIGWKDQSFSFSSYFASGQTFIVLDAEDHKNKASADAADTIGDATLAVLLWNNDTISVECYNGFKCKPTWRYNNEAEMNLVYPYVITKDRTLDNSTLLTTKKCKYQCTSFKSLSLKSMVTLSGQIFTGALFLTKFTEWISGNLGYGLVTDATTAAQIVCLLTQVQYWRSSQCSLFLRKNMRRTMSALQLTFILLVAYLLAPAVAKDGMFTSDYYTALIFLFSGILAVLQKYWSSYCCHPILYTKRMWTGPDGKDDFFDPVSGKLTLDLFQWIHLHPGRRKSLLFWYARKVNEDVAKAAEDKHQPIVICSQKIVYKCSEERAGYDSINMLAVRTVEIKAGVHGQLMGIGEGGKFKVMWFKGKDYLSSSEGESDLNGSAKLFKIGDEDLRLEVLSGQAFKDEVGAPKFDETNATKYQENSEGLEGAHGFVKEEDLRSQPPKYYIGWQTECDPSILFESSGEWSAARNILGLPKLKDAIDNDGAHKPHMAIGREICRF